MFNADNRRQSVTPLDLRQARFETVMRGFDKSQVTTLVTEAAAGFDEALRENERLRQEIARLEGSLQQYRDLESGLKTALLTAQKAADDTRSVAQQDADRIVRDAQGQAALIVERAQARAEDVQREIESLTMKRREAEVGLESVIKALQHTLEFIREQDTRALRLTA
jgi:cell division initiation protein